MSAVRPPWYPGTDLVSAFRSQVRARPDAVAVADPAATMTYAQLLARAGSVAAALRHAGTGRGDVVALRLADPTDRVVAMVATVLAGGCYLALDPQLPPARVDLLLRTAAPRVVLTRASRGPDTVDPNTVDPNTVDPNTVATNTVDTNTVDLDTVGGDHFDDAPLPDPDDLAVLYFTSGTTGEPKGVPLPHRGVIRLFTGEPPMDLPPGTRMANVTYPMFDPTTLEVWGPLLQGGTVVVLPRTALLDPAAVRGELAARRIDTLFLTTALFHEIAARAPGSFADLDSLYVGGEALDGAAVGRVLAAGGPRRLRNVYGPTETTTLATWYPVEADEGPTGVPIGWPVPGTTVRLLDDALRPVPTGQVGELFVGGAGLGPGYLAQPGLTATRYLPDPYSAEPGARLYRTGDLARLRPDGALLFAGRRDRQVKLSGHRVEPEEVEAVLAGHPQVGAAAVEVGHSPQGQPRLEAFVAGPVTAGELRGWLAGRLPGYLVPARITVLERLPTTAAGKVDRAALRSTPADEAPPGSPDEAAGRAGEVAAVWAAVLGLPGVPHDRNFFDLGGSSLLLMQVQEALAARCGLAVTITDLLAHPTVRAQARLLDGARPTGPADGDAPDLPSDRERLRRRRLAIIHGRSGDSDAGE
jgi:amino acid adenylation domain-containing protein